ncbi:hypothetical protein HX109_15740 [Galbibacter sp. BG1]|uniref:hypothetical protein n=1 Tax=Galbibacter sp. BG1 TaxID=1170699 RepID=UPI0015C09AE0|nr:hypothetical protein [Galbibacter sp. BG1]QLE02949.1 hypothetical protein HX109_15740 [Galbibacter sp. BG1]
MKRTPIPFLVFFCVFLFSCKQEPKKEDPEIIELNQAPKQEIIENIPTVACYLFVQEKDSIEMKLEIDADKVYGSLAYNFYEKDKSYGTLEGEINGSILKADYTFKAEGTTSIREVIFLKEDSSFVPGYGEMEIKNGKEVFKQSTSLDFKYGQALNKVSCP